MFPFILKKIDFFLRAEEIISFKGNFSISPTSIPWKQSGVSFSVTMPLS